MSKSWYVVNSYSGYENKAKEQLLERIERENLHEFFGSIEVPTQTITEMKAGKEKETPRVLGFIGGTKNNPKPISEAEANKILQQQEEGIQPSSQITTFEPGEMIRVIDGPFNDFSGVVEEIDQEKSKVKVAVMIFGRSTPVELDFTQIERS